MNALVIADCNGLDRHLKAGQTITVDPKNKEAMREAAELYKAGRLVDDTPENRAHLKRDLAKK